MSGELQEPRVAVVQLKVPNKPAQRLRKVEALLKKSVQKKADLVLFPESFVAEIEDVEAGFDPVAPLSELAGRYEVYLAGANYKEDVNGEIYNAGMLFNPQGELVLEHHKASLCPLEEERGVRAGGGEIELASTPFGEIGILVCKESFFRYSSDFFNVLRQAGAEIVLVPTWEIEVNEKELEFFKTGLLANCRWSCTYVLVANTVNRRGQTFPSFGHSLVVGPRDGILKEGKKRREQILFHRLDYEKLSRARALANKWQPDERERFKNVVGDK